VSGGRLALTFPTATRPGRFTARGAFALPAGFAPTSSGVTLLLHDDGDVFQRSVVSAPSLVTTSSGRTARFDDRNGTVASGLQRLTVSTLASRPGSFRARGLASGPPFGSDVANRVTLVSGSACVSAPLACTSAAGGRTRRCK
jgi:hypothetical protein